MSKSWWSKCIFLMIVTAMSVFYILPTLLNVNSETTKLPFKQKINLGLDLQGGLYMVLGVDFQKVFREVIDRQATQLEGMFKDKSIKFKKISTNKDASLGDDPKIIVEFEPLDRDAVYKVAKEDNWILRLAGESTGKLELGLSREYRVDVRDRTINQSIQVIRNRIDEFGVTEPIIASQGSDRLTVELPGVKDVDRAKDLIGRTAKLEFKIVDDQGMSGGQIPTLIKDLEEKNQIVFKEGEKFSAYVSKINVAAKGKIPEGSEIAFERPRNAVGQETAARVPYLLKSKADVTGEDLADASVAFDQQNQRPYVAFSLSPKGATAFEKLTGDNIGKRLAIVLDGIVHSAPVIQSKIGGNGQITLGQGDGEQVMKEAKDLAIVLRAGALPAQLDFLEQRVVGPSLGQDSIRKGAFASIVGSLAIFLFVLFYYRVSGAIAVFSLILNIIFVLAILVGLEATLTLPGIAGIALTLGIAVDSNVVIYERIREEIRAGKRPFGAVDAGFQKAFRTIVDANVTNAAAAIVLLMYGTGPIKGFAVTMLIGIVTTVFTAVFVCRLIFDLYLKRFEGIDSKDAQTISI